LSEEVEVYEKFLPGFFAARTYNRNLLYIQLITGIKFENSMQLKAWLAKNPEIDGIARFDSNEFADFIYNIYANKIPLTDNRRTIMLLNFPERDSTFYPSDPLIWHTNWKNFNSKAKFINCIGIYWAGYPEEKTRAKQYLKEFSGVDFVEPEKYLQWYRERYCR
jgi:hypothetical protein